MQEFVCVRICWYLLHADTAERIWIKLGIQIEYDLGSYSIRIPYPYTIDIYTYRLYNNAAVTKRCL